MKDKTHSKEIDLIDEAEREPSINIEGRVSNLNKINSHFQVNNLRDEASFIIDLKSGSLSNQSSLCKLLGYCKEPKSLGDLKAMCHQDHIFLVKHVLNTYVYYCQKHLLVQDLFRLFHLLSGEFCL